jgi:hypothetical protein
MFSDNQIRCGAQQLIPRPIVTGAYYPVLHHKFEQSLPPSFYIKNVVSTPPTLFLDIVLRNMNKFGLNTKTVIVML